jgi:hypothetical protein
VKSEKKEFISDAKRLKIIMATSNADAAIGKFLNFWNQ